MTVLGELNHTEMWLELYFNSNAVWVLFSPLLFCGGADLLCVLREERGSLCLPLWHGWEILTCSGSLWLENQVHVIFVIFFFLSSFITIEVPCKEKIGTDFQDLISGFHFLQ